MAVLDERSFQTMFLSVISVDECSSAVVMDLDGTGLSNRVAHAVH